LLWERLCKRKLRVVRCVQGKLAPHVRFDWLRECLLDGNLWWLNDDDEISSNLAYRDLGGRTWRRTVKKLVRRIMRLFLVACLPFLSAIRPVQGMSAFHGYSCTATGGRPPSQKNALCLIRYPSGPSVIERWSDEQAMEKSNQHWQNVSTPAQWASPPFVTSPRAPSLEHQHNSSQLSCHNPCSMSYEKATGTTSPSFLTGVTCLSIRIRCYHECAYNPPLSFYSILRSLCNQHRFCEISPSTSTVAFRCAIKYQTRN
jgi:hypothetical protein